MTAYWYLWVHLCYGKGSNNSAKTQLTFTCSKLTIETLKKGCEIWLKLTIKTPERRQWRRSGVFIVNFEYNLHPFDSASIADFEQVNVSWEVFPDVFHELLFTIVLSFTRDQVSPLFWTPLKSRKYYWKCYFRK